MTPAGHDASPLPPVEETDQRRYQRLKITLLGRYMIESQREYPCQTIDMSPGDLHIQAQSRGPLGEHVVLYLDHLGRIEGDIVRHSPEGFVVAITATARKREKIAAQLMSLARREPVETPEVRRHERIVPASTGIALILQDGTRHNVHIMDISPSGAALIAEVAPNIGVPVIVGRTSARVVRHFKGGFAVEFGEIMGKQDFARMTGSQT